MKGLVLVGLLACGAAHGGEWGAQIHLASVHYVPGDYNEFNPGIGFVYRGEFSVVGGVYRNSHRETSWYAGFGGTRGGVSWYVGGVTGYDDIGTGAVQPMALIQYRIGPGVLSLLAGAIGFGVEI